MLNDRENILNALRDKPLKIFEVMKRANVPNQEACQTLLLKMRDEGLVKFDIHGGRWLIGGSRLTPLSPLEWPEQTVIKFANPKRNSTLPTGRTIERDFWPLGASHASRQSWVFRQPGCDSPQRMKRRQFIKVVAGMAVASPLDLYAQPLPKIARIGFLGSASASGSAKAVEALRSGLRYLGYVEGKNIAIEFRWAEGRYDRLADLVAELVRLDVDVIVTHGTPGTAAAKQVTSTTPIVMAISGDAVATGLVRSLARPEANVTGSTFFIPQLNAKRLELVKEICPHVAGVAALSNPSNPVSRPIIPAMQSAAARLNLKFDVAEVQGPGEFDLAFASIAARRVDAVVVTEDGEFAAGFGAIAALAAANKLPSIGAQEYAK